jgi:hypothetical protein
MGLTSKDQLRYGSTARTVQFAACEFIVRALWNQRGHFLYIVVFTRNR